MYVSKHVLSMCVSYIYIYIYIYIHIDVYIDILFSALGNDCSRHIVHPWQLFAAVLPCADRCNAPIVAGLQWSKLRKGEAWEGGAAGNAKKL